MTESPLERAAKAVRDKDMTMFNKREGGPLVVIQEYVAYAYASSALLAFLDPENDALVERMAKRMHLARYDDQPDSFIALSWMKERDLYLRMARGAINGAKSMAQERGSDEAETP